MTTVSKSNQLISKMVVKSTISIREGFQILEENAESFSTLFIISKDNSMLGTFEFSDFRRGVIHHNIELDHQIDSCIQKNFKFIKENQTLTKNEELHLQKYKFLPVLNKKDEVVDIYNIQTVTKIQKTPIIIMAGGEGKRLLPLTSEVPKPLIEINNKPMVAWIMSRFQKLGFINLSLTINYKKAVIKDYFLNKSNEFKNITYIEESKKLGTAGSLKLVNVESDEPMIITNCDVITLINYRELIRVHKQNQSDITICTKEYQSNIPYGVVGIENGKLTSISEKPSINYSINAATYVINPSIIKYIKDDEYDDFPMLLNRLLGTDSIKIDVFYIHGFWYDIGNLEDYEKIKSVFSKIQHYFE